MSISYIKILEDGFLEQDKRKFQIYFGDRTEEADQLVLNAAKHFDAEQADLVSLREYLVNVEVSFAHAAAINLEILRLTLRGGASFAEFRKTNNFIIERVKNSLTSSCPYRDMIQIASWINQSIANYYSCVPDIEDDQDHEEVIDQEQIEICKRLAVKLRGIDLVDNENMRVIKELLSDWRLCADIALNPGLTKQMLGDFTLYDY